MTTIDKSYSTDPITHAVIELRFSPINEFASNFLFTSLVSEFDEEFPRKEETSVKSLPKEIVDKDPGLKFQPHFILSDGHKTIKIGNALLSISCSKPYVGWEEFQALASKIIAKAIEAGAINEIERIGVRYTNILDKYNETSNSSQFDQVFCDVSLGNQDMKNHRTNIRSEYVQDDFIVITQLGSQTDVMLAQAPEKQKISGLLVDIDIITRVQIEKSLEAINSAIIEAHALEKNVFFSIVKQETMNQYD